LLAPKENEPKEMRFAAVQIPTKIGARSLNGEKLDVLHCVSHIFGQFAVLHALSPPISSRRNLQGGGGIRLSPSIGAITSSRTPLGMQVDAIVLVPKGRNLSNPRLVRE
jgi:hypothetical protein